MADAEEEGQSRTLDRWDVFDDAKDEYQKCYHIRSSGSSRNI